MNCFEKLKVGGRLGSTTKGKEGVESLRERERLRAPKNKPFHIVLHGTRKPAVSYGFSLYSWLPREGTFKECQTREFYHICWWEGYSQHKGAEHFNIFLREALYLRTYLENSLEVEGETLGA